MQSALVLSLAINAFLAVALLITLRRAKRRISEEKSTTFAGCIFAVAAGLAREEKGKETELIAAEIARLRKGMHEEEVRVILARASMIKLFRAPAAADVLGEYGQVMGMATTREDATHEEVWAFIDAWKNGDQEPRERFGDQILAKAQYQLMAQLLRMYRRTFDGETLRVFGSSLRAERFFQLPA